jgi:archaetidylinositol phosphate synthase
LSHNTWVHRIVRPIMRPLVGTRVTPNHLTALRLITGLAAALLLAAGDARLSDIAGAIFLLSFLLDRADGELARQSGRISPSGHRFDLYADYSANILVFLGMGVGMEKGALGGLGIALGAVAGAAIGMIFWIVSRVERLEGPAAFPTAKGFDPDDGMILIPLAIWLGAERYILTAAAIGAPAFLAWTSWHFRRSLGLLPAGRRAYRGPRHHERRPKEKPRRSGA